ncbi:MAG TPA: C40 family peptidase, partial [Armatimonadota bacterium]|nr:C40 family peptidase [Armatimonadota bacterium]
TARRFLGVPYLWGGGSPVGLDCSGFVQLVMRLHGVELLRDAGPQMTQGEPVEAPDAADLVFFGPEGEPDRISHVGMMLDRERFIHAAGSDRVRINRLRDDPYGRIYRGARRVLPRGR